MTVSTSSFFLQSFPKHNSETISKAPSSRTGLRYAQKRELQQILNQRQGCLVSNQSEVGMQLQDGAGSLRSDGAEEAVLILKNSSEFIPCSQKNA